jgi:hypothetical protein
MSANSEGPTAELVLAAIDRAITQSIRPVSAASDRAIADHLALSRRSGAWRQARRRLRELEDAAEVEQGRRKGIPVWAITQAGRERLGRAVDDGRRPVLPESPQHRLWTDSRRLAVQEADRFSVELSAALNEGLRLLHDGETPSQAWLALSARLRRATERVAAVAFCQDEWPEPQEGAPDRSEGPVMRSRGRFGEWL